MKPDVKQPTKPTTPSEGLKYLEFYGRQNILLNEPNTLLDIEYLVSLDPKFAYFYARDHLKGPFKIGEPALSQDAHWAFQYSLDVLKSPFKEAEPTLAQDPYLAASYASFILKDRFELAEPTIASDAYSSLMYSEILGERFYLGEPAIAKDAALSLEYSKKHSFQFKLGESVISLDAKLSFEYAKAVLKDRFLLGEPVIAKNSSFYERYIGFIKQTQVYNQKNIFERLKYKKQIEELLVKYKERPNIRYFGQEDILMKHLKDIIERYSLLKTQVPDLSTPEDFDLSNMGLLEETLTAIKNFKELGFSLDGKVSNEITVEDYNKLEVLVDKATQELGVLEGKVVSYTTPLEFVLQSILKANPDDPATVELVQDYRDKVTKAAILQKGNLKDQQESLVLEKDAQETILNIFQNLQHTRVQIKHSKASSTFSKSNSIEQF